MGYKFSVERTKTRLYRANDDSRIAGVCGGIADYLGISSTYVRLGWIAALLLFNAIPFFTYILLWMFLPRQPRDLYLSEAERTAWAHIRREPRGSVQSLRTHFDRLEKRLQQAEAHVTSAEFKMDQELRRS